ncbi:hypothetical protein F5B20DRAFT_579923 [Whalleya microplaca]|nr:hypothetical protein F5B20DRAFT_579923 [Whalleya microplaca]
MDEFTLDFLPEGGLNNFHTINAPNQDFRRVFMRTSSHSSPLNMRGKIVELHHGRMVYEEERCFASLLVLEFRFQSELNARRYKSVNVTFELFDKDGNSDYDPVIVKVSPDRVCHLNQTPVTRTTSKGLDITAKVGPAGLRIDPGIHWTIDEEYTVNYKATLTGLTKTSDGKTSDGENAVTWTMEENKKQGDGIPSTAILIKHYNRPFYAKTRARSTVDWVSTARRVMDFSTDEDKIIDPVTFTPKVAQLRNNMVPGIRKEDLDIMEKLPVGSYFKVNLSDAVQPNDDVESVISG